MNENKKSAINIEQLYSTLALIVAKKNNVIVNVKVTQATT